MLSVQQGATFTGGLFTVQLGELRAVREGSQNPGSPGVVVCVSTVAGSERDDDEGVLNGVKDEEEVDFEFAQAAIRDFWVKIKEGRDLGRAEGPSHRARMRS